MRHRTTDPACKQYRPPRGRLSRWLYDRNRGRSCPRCFPPAPIIGQCPETYPADLYDGCPCFECDQAPRIAAEKAAGGFGWPDRMSLCPVCGSKRCPGALDHTQHLEPGGSR